MTTEIFSGNPNAQARAGGPEVLNLKRQIAELQKADADDVDGVRQQLRRIDEAQAKKEQATFAKLRVSWEMNGTKKYIEAKEEMDIETFLKSVAGLTPAVRDKVKRDTAPKTDEPSPGQVKRAYNQRRDQRLIKISHLEQRLQQLEKTEVVDLPRTD